MNWSSLVFVWAIFSVALGGSANRPVGVEITIISIEAVDGLAQRFTTDFYLLYYYQDAKLNMSNGDKRDVSGELSEFDAVQLEMKNSNDATFVLNSILAYKTRPNFIDANKKVLDSANTAPWVVHDQRVRGVFRASMSLQDFPFDSQIMFVAIESGNFGISKADIFPVENSDFVDQMSQVTEWTLERALTKRGTIDYKSYGIYSHVEFQVMFKRQSAYYVDKIVVGVVFLVVMSFFTCMFEPCAADRPCAVATLYLGVVSYLFIVTSAVPKVPYATRLDKFIQLSMLILFINFIYQCCFVFVSVAVDRQAKIPAEPEQEEQGEGLVEVGAEQPRSNPSKPEIGQHQDVNPLEGSAQENRSSKLRRISSVAPQGVIATRRAAKKAARDAVPEKKTFAMPILDNERFQNWWERRCRVVDCTAGTILAIVYMVCTLYILIG